MSGQVRVRGVAHPVVRIAPRPPVRRHGEGDLLRHRRRREILGFKRLRGEARAAAAGRGGEVAEERPEARAPAEHPAGRFVATVRRVGNGLGPEVLMGFGGGWAGTESQQGPF